MRTRPHRPAATILTLSLWEIINSSGWWVEPAGDNLCTVARDSHGTMVGRFNPRQSGAIPYDRWLAAVDRLRKRRTRAS